MEHEATDDIRSRTGEEALSGVERHVHPGTYGPRVNETLPPSALFQTEQRGQGCGDRRQGSPGFA